jgi:hypothetical protein
MFRWLKNFQADIQANRLVYEKPILFKDDGSFALKKLLEGQYGHFIRTRIFSEIPVGSEYYEIIDGHRFVLRKKHKRERTGLASTSTQEEYETVLDHNYGYGRWSAKFEEKHLGRLVWNERVKRSNDYHLVIPVADILKDP